MLVDFIGLLLLLAGFIIGLGAVTVIDLHGFLGRKSPYWNEATIRTHKVTKPLIWIGIFLVTLGGSIFYRGEIFSNLFALHGLIIVLLIINGFFLSFRVSPYLLELEKAGRSQELLPVSWQRKIMVSLIVSDFGWWGSLALVVWHIVSKIYV